MRQVIMNYLDIIMSSPGSSSAVLMVIRILASKCNPSINKSEAMRNLLKRKIVSVINSCSHSRNN